MAIVIINNQISEDTKRKIIEFANQHCQCKKHLHEQCNVGTNIKSYFIADSKTTQFNEESVRVFCHNCVQIYHHSKLQLPILKDDEDSLIQKK